MLATEFNSIIFATYDISKKFLKIIQMTSSLILSAIISLRKKNGIYSLKNLFQIEVLVSFFFFDFKFTKSENFTFKKNVKRNNFCTRKIELLKKLN